MADDRSRYAVVSTFIILSVLIIFLFTRRHNKRLQRTITHLPVSRPPPVPSDRVGNANSRWSQDGVVFLTPSGGNNGHVFVAMPQQAHIGAQDTRGVWDANITSGQQGRTFPGIYFMEGTRIRFAGQESGHDDLPRYEEPPPGYDKVIGETAQQNSNTQELGFSNGQGSSSGGLDRSSSTGGVRNTDVAGTSLPLPSASPIRTTDEDLSGSSSQQTQDAQINTTATDRSVNTLGNPASAPSAQ